MIKHIPIIHDLFQKAGECNIPLWLESGWAIDARLGRMTRDHSDIDIAFPNEKREAYLQLLEDLGFMNFEEQDYGFLIHKGNVLIDSEPCFLKGEDYNFPNFPPGSCPWKKEGVIFDIPVRCLSWEAMYVEFLGYEVEVPLEMWRLNDRISRKMIEQHLSEVQIDHLKRKYAPYGEVNFKKS